MKINRTLVCGLLCVGLVLASSSLCTAAPTSVHRWGAFGTEGETETPLPVDGIESEVQRVDAGNAAAYALTASGALLAWGGGQYGELGDGTTGSSYDAAVQVRFPAGVKIVGVGEARATGFAVDSTGHAWAWGEGSKGSDCLGKHVEDLDEPHEIPGLSGVAAVQGGAEHSIWLLQNGTVMACGSNTDGELGTGETGKSVYAPVAVPGLSKIVEVSAGQAVSCARSGAGAVYDWGSDSVGQVGNGKFQSAVPSPYKVALPEAATQISCGGNLARNGSTLALLHGGGVYGWGADESGQLGDGKTEARATPAPAAELASLDLKQVVASGEYGLGVNAAGDVYAWGSNARHALGTSQKVKSSLAPLLVDTGAVEVSATAYDSTDRG